MMCWGGYDSTHPLMSLFFAFWRVTISQLLASHRLKISLPYILARCFECVAEVSIDILDHSLVSMAGKCKRLSRY